MNKELERAVEILKREKHSCVILNPGCDPICSDALGIKPLMVELRKNRKAFQHGVIADKVIGKAAAMMMIYGGAAAVYGGVMSEDAVNVLRAHQIEFAYDKVVPVIENRTKTGRCPMEQTVLEIENLEDAFEALEETIQKLMKQKEQSDGR